MRFKHHLGARDEIIANGHPWPCALEHDHDS
jgi:hypothetical protein